MFKLLIVEDEDYMRKTILTCIDWQSLGFIVDEAEDGDIALKKVETFRPDAVITDIRMPIVDGLELARSLSENHPEIVVLIISGHDEFEYAKQAVSLGVWEYLQKPILPRDFTAIMVRLREHLVKASEQKESITQLQLQLHESLPLLKFQFLNRLISRSFDNLILSEKLDLLGLSLDAKQYAIALFSAQDLESKDRGEDPLIQFALRNVIEEEIGHRGFCFEDSSGRLVMLYLIKDQINEDREFIFTLVDSLRLSNQYALEFTITASIGATVNSIAELPFSYETALSALEQQIIRGKGNLYDHQDFAHIEVEEYQFFSQVEELILAFHFRGVTDFLHLLKKLDGAILSKTARVNPTSVRIALIDLINGINKILLESGCSLPSRSNKIYNDILSMERFEDLFLILTGYLIESKKLLGASHLKHTTSLVQGVCYFIQQNFSDPELSLNQAADQAFISSVYLSTLFKKEIGVTFVDYVTSTRLEEAKKLLQTDNYKNYEIANMIGYNDPQYFSNCFKKYTGMTPSQYRSAKVN